MAQHSYRIGSQEGVDRYGGEIGDEVKLDLSVAEAKAVVAAGWVEPLEEVDDKKKEK